MGGLVNTLRSWGDRASFEADRFMRQNRVRSEITKIKKDIETTYAELGRTVAATHQTGRLPDSAVIDNAVHRIEQLQRELQAKEAEALTVQNEKWVEDTLPSPQIIEGQAGYGQPSYPNTYPGPPVPPASPYSLPSGSYSQQPQQSYQQPVQSYEQPQQSYQPPVQQQSYQQPQQSYQPPTNQQPVPAAPPPATSVPNDTMTQAMSARHCLNCGAELRPNARFCPICGTPSSVANS